MRIETFICNPYSECTYIVEYNGVVYVIDPGMYTNREKTTVQSYLDEHQLTPAYILVTHKHPDHVCGIEYLQEKYPNIEIVDYFNQKALDGISILYTPGHKSDAICFYFEKESILFTGDTLFKSSIGRTDLPTGDFETLIKSLQKLQTLPPQTVIYPGHGPTTTLADEIECNPYL